MMNLCKKVITFLLIIVLISRDVTSIENKAWLEQWTQTIKGKDLILTGSGKLNGETADLSNLRPYEQVIIIGDGQIDSTTFSDKNWIKQFNLDDRITFGARCFQRTGVSSFVFPSAQKSIPEGTFDGCKSLTSIIFPSNCNSLGDWAFNSVAKIIDFYYYGTTIPTVNSESFPNKNKIKVHCSRLKRTFLSGAASQDDNIAGELDFYFGTYLIDDGSSVNIKMTGTLDHPYWLTQIYRCQPTPTTTVTIHSNSLILTEGWFNQAPKVTSLVFNNTGKIVFNAYAFTGSTTIKGIKFDGVGAYAFNIRVMQSSSVDFAEFGEHVTTIGEAMFDTCRQLKTVKIMGSVTLNQWIFNKCSSLSSFIYCGSTVSAVNDNPGQFGGDISIPAAPFKVVEVTSNFVGNSFYGKGISKTANIAYNTDKSIQLIFTGCSIEISGAGTIQRSDVENAVMPQKCITCQDKTKITSVSLISENLNIGANAFEGCTSLATVKVKHVAIFGSLSFMDCSSLEKIFYCSPIAPTVSETAFELSSTYLRVIVPYDFPHDNFGSVNVKNSKILNNECSIQTLPFTHSSIFTRTFEFQATLDKFSKSNNFDYSIGFTKSSILENSAQFSNTNIFKETVILSKSDFFEKTNPFSKSKEFNKSSYFDSTMHFSNTNDFHKSKLFSQSRSLNSTFNFSYSSVLIDSSLFSISSEHKSSSSFTRSEQFFESDDFTQTVKHATSLPFFASNTYSKSFIFYQSIHFSKTESTSNIKTSEYESRQDIISSNNSFYKLDQSESIKNIEIFSTIEKFESYRNENVKITIENVLTSSRHKSFICEKDEMFYSFSSMINSNELLSTLDDSKKLKSSFDDSTTNISASMTNNELSSSKVDEFKQTSLLKSFTASMADRSSYHIQTEDNLYSPYITKFNDFISEHESTEDNETNIIYKPERKEDNVIIDRKNKNGMIAGIVVAIVLTILIIFTTIIFFILKCKHSDGTSGDFEVSVGNEFETNALNEFEPYYNENSCQLPTILLGNTNFKIGENNDHEYEYDYEYFEELVPISNKYI